MSRCCAPGRASRSATRSGSPRRRCRPFAGSIIRSEAWCWPNACTNRARRCAAAITAGSASNSRSRSLSSRTSRRRRKRRRRSRRISTASAPRSKWSTTVRRITAISMCARWWRTIPGMPGIVLSNFAAQWPDLESMLGKATKDGAPIGEGYGRDILGHPFNSVAWLNAQLASRGGGLRKGQVVMTGSVMKTVFPTEPADLPVRVRRPRRGRSARRLRQADGRFLSASISRSGSIKRSPQPS